MYQSLFNVDKSKVWRAVIVLQDWEPGHYFDIEDRAIVNYKKGQLRIYYSRVYDFQIFNSLVMNFLVD